MLKKVLYNKFIIEDIPDELPMNSEEILKFIFTKKNCIMFKYNKELRLCRYTGYDPDWLGRATKYQPQALAGAEVYPVKTDKNCVKYNENPLQSQCFQPDGYIIDDIETYITLLDALDKAVLINSKQIYMPFIAKVCGGSQAKQLKEFMRNIFGKGFEGAIIESSLEDKMQGTTIQPTNMQVFLATIQDTKKKILDEAFYYLGVSSPEGKLAHQSELEIEKASASTDLLDKIMFSKIDKFLNDCNSMFKTNMKLKRNIGE